MKLTKETIDEGTCVVVAEGKIEHDNAADFERFVQEVIRQEGDRHVLVDLSRIEYISSAGLRVFLILAKTMQSAKRGFGVCSPTEVVRQAFVVTGFNRIISLYDSRQDADFSTPSA